MSRKLRLVPTSSRSRRAFVDAVLAGEAAWNELDDWVAEWHSSDSEQDLHEWLGLTFEEYAVLGESDRNLAAILFARRHSLSLEAALDWYREEPIAARGDGDPSELQALLVAEGLVLE